MMHAIDNRRPIIDLTKETDRQRLEELEDEVERLNEIVTRILMQNRKGKA